MRAEHFFLLGLLTCGLASAEPRASSMMDFALIVGNNRHLEDPERLLNFADDDAIMAAEQFLLLHPDGELWLLVEPDEQTMGSLDGRDLAFRRPTLPNWEQSIGEIARRIASLRTSRHQQARVFVFFAGHGESGGMLHFLDGYLTGRDFRSDLARLEADEIFALLDGCYSGQMSRGSQEGGSSSAPPIFVDKELDVPNRPEWLGMIGLNAIEIEPWYLEGGLLSHLGIGGLSGPADLDGDERISFTEWSRYVTVLAQSMKDGPGITIVPLRRDPFATVVDLRKSQAGGIRFAADFPPGFIRIQSQGSETPVAELYHFDWTSTSVRLPPGTYDVIRLKSRVSWKHAGIPVDRITTRVQSRMVLFDRSTVTIAAVLLQTGAAARGAFPEGTEIIRVSPTQYSRLEGSPVAGVRKRSAFDYPSAWAFSANLGHQGFSLDWAEPYIDHGAWRPGMSLRAERRSPVWQKGRWFVGLGFVAQYGLQVDPRMYLADNIYYDRGYRHEARVGAVQSVSRVGARAALDLSVSIAYAPSLVAVDFQRLSQAEMEEESGSDVVGPGDDVFLTNFAADLELSIRFPVSDRWSLGPTLRGDLLYGGIPSSSDGRAFVPQIWAGVTLQQRFSRNR